MTNAAQDSDFFFCFVLKKWKLQLNDCVLTPRQDSGQLFAVAVLSRQCYRWLCQRAARCSSRSPSALDMPFTCAPAKLRHRRRHRSGQDQVSRNKRTPARFISEITSEKPVFFSPIISLARGSALRVRLLRPDLLRCACAHLCAPKGHRLTIRCHFPSPQRGVYLLALREATRAALTNSPMIRPSCQDLIFLLFLPPVLQDVSVACHSFLPSAVGPVDTEICHSSHGGRVGCHYYS